MRLLVDFCCNDDRNGAFTGRCDAIHLPDGAMELTCQMPRGMAIDIAGDYVKIGRLKLPHYGHRTWHGNWCWDAVSLELRDVIRLLEYVRKDNCFTCEGGWCAITDLWEAGKLTETILQMEFFITA